MQDLEPVATALRLVARSFLPRVAEAATLGFETLWGKEPIIIIW